MESHFSYAHTNINVLDLEKSLAFYKEALGLSELRRIDAKDGSFHIVYLSDDGKRGVLELTQLRDRTRPYELGDNETHIAFHASHFEAARKKHEKMGCICLENPEMGIYFIEDPDGYWLEILPK